MKVLQVNVVWRKGSTGKITADIHEELLRQGHESVVCYGRGEVVDEPNVYKTCGELYSKVNNAMTRITGVMYGGLNRSTKKLISIIEKEKPDIVHLQCINGYFVNIYKLITWLKAHQIKTVLTLHAEFMYTANCGHALDCEKWLTGCGNCPRRKQEIRSLWRDGTAISWKRMKKAFEVFGRDCVVVSVSPWLMNRAEQSPVLAALPHCVVLNGVDTAIFQPCETEALRKQHDLEDKKVIFHATAHFSANPNHLKGGWIVLELAKRLPEAQFLVAGNYDAGVTVPENVALLGNLSDQRLLAQYYSLADITLLTSKRETFSMVLAESLCCGTPVVGMNAGGPESIALPEYCCFAEQGDLDKLESLLRTAIAEEKNAAAVAQAGEQAYRIGAMCEGYLKVYQRLLHWGGNVS